MATRNTAWTKGEKSNCTGDLQNCVVRFNDSCLMVLRDFVVLADALASSPRFLLRFRSFDIILLLVNPLPHVGEYVQGTAE